MLTSALAALTTHVDHLTYGKAGPGENPTATPSGFFDPNTEEQVRMHVEHRVRSGHPSLLAITGDKMDWEEVALLAPRKGLITSGKLRSADTSSIHVPHEFVFTPE